MQLHRESGSTLASFMAEKQLVSVSVVSSNRCLVPWSVILVDPRDSFEDLLNAMRAGKYGTIPTEPLLDRADSIETVLVGNIKPSLSIVGKDMNVVQVCRTFGFFIKISVAQPEPPRQNAFDILMANQRKLSRPALPEYVEERTKRDKLFDDIVKLLEGMGKKWCSGEVQSGKSFLMNVILYIDGHHESIEIQACGVPELFILCIHCGGTEF